MDSDDSSSECNSESSEYTTATSDDEELETVYVCRSRAQIPQGLCENKEIFQDFFSEQTWNSLSDANKHHLRSFLPTFPENDDEEKEITLRRLFNRHNFKFSTPFENFYEHLKAGHYRPDIARMRLLIRQAQRKEAKWRHKKYREKLEEEVKQSRQRLLSQVRNIPPGIEVKQQKASTSSITNIDPTSYRTKKRYFQELSNIKTNVGESGFSSDENYPEGPPVSLTRKQKKHLTSIKNELVASGEKLVVSTLGSKQNSFDLERNVLPNNNPYSVTEETYRILLANHRKRKLQIDIGYQEDNTNGITVTDIINRTRLDYKKLPAPIIKLVEPKPIKKKPRYEYRMSISPDYLKLNNNLTSNSECDSDSDSFIETDVVKLKNNRKVLTKPIKTEIQIEPEINVELPSFNTTPINVEVNESTSVKSEPINEVFNLEPTIIKEPVKLKTVDSNKKYRTATLSDLDGIDMMNIPIELDDAEILDLNRPELMQDTHSNFLSLIRDIICSTTEHRMDMSNLRDRLRTWQENPISPLNDWYCLNDNWLNLLQSAITFLIGNSADQPEDFVPYIEYKQQLDVYQWIGAGRDSDNLLSNLCVYWLDHRNEDRATPIKEELDMDVTDRAQTPPPPRCPTSWSVQRADGEEIRLYREQEKKRYDNPHKSFTYRCNGYESIVGPIKGIYNSSTSSTKARGHNMLCADRPNFVTILSLVRDATARLPNGEGTRAEICELLKCSQYISSSAPENVLQSVVSGALDRMHTQFDPCVKYDSKRKIWIYLHRNRSEEDFERIHQQHQTMGKHIKRPVKVKTPSKPKPAKAKSSPEVTTTTVVPISSPVTVKTPPITPDFAPKLQPTSLLKEQLSLLGNKTTTKSIDVVTTAVVSQPIESSSPKTVKTRLISQDEKVINDAIQSQVNPAVKSLKPGKSLMKIIQGNQTKSLIIPKTVESKLKPHKIIKPVETQPSVSSTEQPTSMVNTLSEPVTPITVSKPIKTVNQYPVKQVGNSITTQQLLQTLVQKQSVVKQTESEPSDKTQTKVQHQLIQSLTPQQIQNIKNVTLLRNVPRPVSSQQQQQSNILLQSDDMQSTASSSSSTATSIISQPIKIQQQPMLTVAQQQQILSSLKQKGVQMANLSSLQQQVLLKQKSTEAAIPKSVYAGASLLGNSKSPTGSTLRMSGKSHSNIIQISSPTKQSQPISSANNQIITINNQNKLVLSTQQTATVTTTMTTTKPTAKTINKPQTITKFAPKQIINAKFVTDTQKLPTQQKMIIGQNQIRFGNKTFCKTAANVNAIRMMNASNLNITHISGKPVLLASKGTSLQGLQSGNIIIQTQANTSNANLVTLNAGKQSSSNTITTINQSGQMVLAPQLKVQPQLVQMKNNTLNQAVSQGQQILVGGHPVRLQSNVTNTQRLVLASQGQGGQIVAQQILLPAGFQGTAINIKGLQGVKVIPISPGQPNKNMPRQVFARVMSPTGSLIRTAPQSSNVTAAEVVRETTSSHTVPTTE